MDNAPLAIDGHVHLYSAYDLTRAVERGTKNLLAAAQKYVRNDSDMIPIWLLVERSDMNFFKQIYNAPENFNLSGIKFKKGNDELTIIAEKDRRIILYIFAGRQLVTQEGLEVLSLVSKLNIPDRQKAIDEIITQVKTSGGIPALNWAPGKWFFKRGQVIAKQILEKPAGEFLIGDTTLRHQFWPLPKLIRQATTKGFSVIAGSDPLPFKGEEDGIGSYGFLLEGKFNPDHPAQSLRDLINDRPNALRIVGRRNDIFTFTKREYKIMMEKKERS